MKVIDISANNSLSESDWLDIKKTCDGVIIRAGFRSYSSSGNLVIDTKAKTYIAKCKSYGIPYGLYFVTQATTTTEATAEVQWLERNYGDLSEIAWGIWVDVEESGGRAKARASGTATKNLPSYRQDKLSKSARTTVIAAWCKTCAATGAFVGVYTSASWFATMLDDSKLTVYGHWAAQYGSKCSYTNPTGWQFSAKNAFGIGTLSDLDCSYFYKKVSDYVMTADDVKAAVKEATADLTATIKEQATTIKEMQQKLADMQKTVDAAKKPIGEESWAAPYMEEAEKLGLMTNEGSAEYTTRGQLAFVVTKAISLMEKE